MYELVMLADDEWILMISDKARFHGSFKNVMKICLGELKIDSEQLEEAVKELCKHNDHDTAHFGIYRTFMFSYNSKEDQFKRKVV